MIDYYNEFGLDYAQATVNVDMRPIYDRFLKYLSSGDRILDAGCGSGRDSLALKYLGYDVSAFDASPTLVEYARELTGLPIRQQRFQDMVICEVYDGIWACASLLHVSKDELLIVLRKLANALRCGGVFYMSYKCGEGERHQKDGRMFNDMMLDELLDLLNTIENLCILEWWESADQRPHRDDRWLNAITKRVT